MERHGLNRTPPASLRIYVDFDDVVVETARGLAELLYRETGRRISYEQIEFFDLRRSFHLDAAAYCGFMERAHDPKILDKLEETPGACATLRAWLDAGLVPVIVTGRPASSHSATRRWLDRRGLADLSILHVDKYNRDLGPPEPGVPTLRFTELGALAFDLAIDDAPPALDLLVESRLCPYIVFDRPWNRHYGTTPPHLFGRASDWCELDLLVLRHAVDVGSARATGRRSGR